MFELYCRGDANAVEDGRRACGVLCTGRWTERVEIERVGEVQYGGGDTAAALVAAAAAMQRSRTTSGWLLDRSTRAINYCTIVPGVQ